ncbi:hypothetical protein EMIT0P12_10949 [Pseudomonas sp. IT-P12]
MGKHLDLPVVHLDILYWKPDWVAPDAEQFRLSVSEAIATNAWMCEGNHALHTFELRREFRSCLPSYWGRWRPFAPGNNRPGADARIASATQVQRCTIAAALIGARCPPSAHLVRRDDESFTYAQIPWLAEFGSGHWIDPLQLLEHAWTTLISPRPLSRNSNAQRSLIAIPLVALWLPRSTSLQRRQAIRTGSASPNSPPSPLFRVATCCCRPGTVTCSLG